MAVLKDKDPTTKTDEKKDKKLEEDKPNDGMVPDEEDELEEVAEEEQNPNTVVVGSQIYLIDRMTFAYVKSH